MSRRGIRHDQRGDAWIGDYLYHIGDASYDWVDIDPQAEAMWVEAFGQRIPNSAAGREVFWDAILAYLKKAGPGDVIVAWGYYPRDREWQVSLVRRSLAKKYGVPHITQKMATQARNAARSGKIPRSVKVLRA